MAVAYVAVVWVVAWNTSGSALAAVALVGAVLLVAGVALTGRSANVSGAGLLRLLGVALVATVVTYMLGAAIAFLVFSNDWISDTAMLNPSLA